MINWLSIIFVFGAMLCWGVGDFLIQKTVRRLGSIMTIAWIGVFSSILLLPFVVGDLLHLSLSEYLILIIAGVVTYFSAYFHFQALAIGKFSVVEIILTIELPITILFGIVFFQETLDMYQVFMVLALMVGVGLISYREDGDLNFWQKIANYIFRYEFFKKERLEKGAWLALLTGVFLGIVNFVTAYGAKEISPLLSIWLPWFIFSIISLAYLVTHSQFAKMWQLGWQAKSLVIPMAILDIAAWLFYVYAVKDNSLSVTIIITQSYPVIAVLLAVSINRERLRWYQYGGVILAMSASILISFV
ncbi:MAG: hypothetical protein COX77_02730 [Candidatus Komeilibacteria bacterium CG_4_10_14_0_2_um_filter_37_10]|uniref:EamA domain-containing protein n=1 Tax=Candidatus Komeilibacteria bacterium CG_4_10_14_0_2_um_filter_37_10 TaxID=1974470 RepID=A0A2M7VER5_9BACT|nr:MAG: hypothetical protein COX77_02730 [Candidatus Komeilibacteria bacterium CG_4_10_14_0_2_um_filter_37_10]